MTDTTLEHAVPHRVLALLAAPALPMAAMTLPLTIFLPNYYAGSLGMNLATVGLIFALVRLLDLIFDPLAGAIMDRTATRFGRFRPWMLAGGPLTMAGAWLLFLAPPGSGPAHLALALVVSYGGYSIVNLSQMGLSAGVTTRYAERSRVFAWWQGLNIFGVFLVLAGPALISNALHGNFATTVHAMGWFVIVTTPVAILLMLATVVERPAPDAPHRAHLRDMLSLLTLPATRILLAAVFLGGLGLGIASAVFLFFFTIVKGITTGELSVLLSGFFILNMASAPVWAWIGNRIGKHNGFAMSLVGYAAYFAVLGLLPSHRPLLLALIYVPGGFFACGQDLFPRSMMADVSDADRLSSGHDRTAMLYALLILTYKLGQALSIGVVFVALDLVRFAASAGAHNSPLALHSVAILYVAVPAALYVLTALVTLRYPLDAAAHARVMARLASESVA